MNREASITILQCVRVGILAGSLVFLPSCYRPESIRGTGGAAKKGDPLLGRWVMIADNGTGANGTIADYRPDGTVLFTQKGKTTTVRYKRESGEVWVNRRAAGLGLPGTSEGLDHFRKPGVEMIEFAGPDGKFMDYGGSLLTLDPDRRVLYNILTQLWCRPGEEARVRSELRSK